MGCDIHGVVEGLNAHDRWTYGANVGSLVGRSYDTFGCLWGVRNSAGFDPAFPKRGLPEDIGIYTKSEVNDWGGREHIGAIDFHSPSWATMEELHNLDWDETADHLDSRYSILDENKEPTGTKAAGFGGVSGWSDIIRENREAIDNGEVVPNEDGSRYIQRVEMTRKEALSGSWEWLIFDLMPSFSERFEEVRMVVWFDN